MEVISIEKGQNSVLDSARTINYSLDKPAANYPSSERRESRSIPNFQLKGFTLVELLIVILVMAIIATVGTDVLISTMRSSNKANIINEINQNANFVMSTIGSVMTNGKTVTCISCTSGVGKELYIIDQYNQPNYFCIGAGTVKRSTLVDCPAGSSSNLTNTNTTNGVFVDSAASQFSVSTSTPPLVTITLKITQGSSASTRIDYKAETTFTKSFELRKY